MPLIWVIIGNLEWFCPNASFLYFEAQLNHFEDLGALFHPNSLYRCS